jgi:hypothetical protein
VLLFLLVGGTFLYPFATDVRTDKVVQRSLERTFESEGFRETYVAGTEPRAPGSDASPSSAPSETVESVMRFMSLLCSCPRPLASVNGTAAPTQTI